MQIELEKTYLLKYIPKDLKNYPNNEYLDIYIPSLITHPVLRIRKRGAEYEITKKYPINWRDTSKQHEFTISLNQAEFDELEANLKGKRAQKQRYLYEYQGKIVEIDVFNGDLKGLILADFEFQTEEEMAKFIPPDFCLIEVTQEKATAGGMLVGKKYQDIEPILATFGYKPLFLE